MADENVSSTQVANAEASPIVFNDANVDGGVLREVIGILETTLAAAGTGSIYRMVRVPSNARISELFVMTDDMGTTGDINVGIHQTSDNGGLVVDADLFASAIDVNAAAVGMTSILHESGQITLDETILPLWGVLGLTSDPGIDYDITIMPSEAFTATGTMLIKCRYVV